METSASPWSVNEKRQVIAVAIAPAAVVATIAAPLSFLLAEDFTLLAIFALPIGYLTLFLFVLPALILLRRCGKESGASFVGTVCLSVSVPWGLLYLAYAAATPIQEHPPLALIAVTLLTPAAVSAVAASVVWWLFIKPRMPPN